MPNLATQAGRPDRSRSLPAGRAPHESNLTGRDGTTEQLIWRGRWTNSITKTDSTYHFSAEPTRGALLKLDHSAEWVFLAIKRNAGALSGDRAAIPRCGKRGCGSVSESTSRMCASTICTVVARPTRALPVTIGLMTLSPFLVFLSQEVPAWITLQLKRYCSCPNS